MYYLQSRYYNPTLGRFINADALASTGQGLIGNNNFAYCGNNPVSRTDSEGTFFDIIVDVGSLLLSVAEVVSNPTDVCAWIGLALDAADVILPGVTGLGEVADAVNAARKAADKLDELSDVTKAASEIPVVIGETMERVCRYADEIGAEVFSPPDGLTRDALMDMNRKWIQEAMDQGRTIYDIGFDVNRTSKSVFYQMERFMTKDYDKCIRIAGFE